MNPPTFPESFHTTRWTLVRQAAGSDERARRLFQRRWALTLLDHSFDLLRQEYTAAGKAALFETLSPFLGFGPDPEKRYEEIAAASGTPVATLKTRVFRLRQRWRELLFQQVAATLDAPTEQEIKAELGELLTCM